MNPFDAAFYAFLIALAIAVVAIVWAYWLLRTDPDLRYLRRPRGDR